MQVFKLFFSILKAHKRTILLYTAIFMALALLMTGEQSPTSNSSNPSDKAVGDMEQVSMNIAVIDLDKKTLGAAIKEYSERTNTVVDMEYDEKQILNDLYWRTIRYVLIIPEGFEEGVINGEDVSFQSMKVPGTYSSSYYEAQLELYMSKLKGLLASGYDIEEAEEVLKELEKETVDVSLADFVNADQHGVLTVFFNYAPYLFLALSINGIGMLLMQYNKKEVADRMECSATPMKKRLAGLTTGIVVYGIAMFLLVFFTAAVISGGTLCSDRRTPYFALNMFAMIILSLSFGFLAGTVAKSVDAINGMQNVINLSFCFMGGVFVPQEYFGEGILPLAKLFPTYWYVANNNAIGALTETTTEFRKTIVSQAGVMLGYALAIFALTVVIVYQKRQQR